MGWFGGHKFGFITAVVAGRTQHRSGCRRDKSAECTCDPPPCARPLGSPNKRLALESARLCESHADHIQVFVANPHKPPQIASILKRNREKLVGFLKEFHNDKEGEYSHFCYTVEFLWWDCVGRWLMDRRTIYGMSPHLYYCHEVMMPAVRPALGRAGALSDVGDEWLGMDLA